MSERNLLSSDEGKAIGQRLDFAKMNNLEYLDMVIHETVRMHPTVPILWRVCTKGSVVYDIHNVWILIISTPLAAISF